ncbi:MAG: hypothetical protein JWO90_1327 [Solirubrobacterales bacterium]|jgi:hypothetical protein|nr:hypothetical protein [Solirubrobacterales bacterium]
MQLHVVMTALASQAADGAQVVTQYGMVLALVLVLTAVALVVGVLVAVVTVGSMAVLGREEPGGAATP